MDLKIFDLPNTKPFIKDVITIGYTGTPSRKDGVLDLIESFAILNKKYTNIHLLIIGDSVNVNNSFIPKLNERALELGISTKITFTGLVSFSEIPRFLNSCQILGLTRPNGVFAEAGFPTKLGEYFACRKPVLITTFGDIPIYFKNEEHVIMVNCEDIDSIVKGFEKLINDSKLCQKISTNAYNWMESNLYYKNISSNLSGFIDHI